MSSNSGGEPFLYHELNQLISFCRQTKMMKRILIATNGLIMPNEKLLQCFYDNQVTIRISDYNINHEKVKKLKETCNKRNIHCYSYDFASGNHDWYQLGNNIKCEENDKIVSARFKNCEFNICLTLEDGRLVYCSRAINASEVQGFSIRKRDFVYISERNLSLQSELKEYVEHPSFMEACRYCNGTNKNQMCVAGEQL